MKELISVKNLHVSYGKYEVLSDISFSINEKDYVAIIGPNGSGKTTLVKTLLNLIEPAKGQIIYKPDLNIGYLPQRIFLNDALFPATVYEVVSMGILLNGNLFSKVKKEYNEKINDILKTLGIEDLKNKKIGALSGGQQQRVLLARALVTSAKLLILDEPTSALDPLVREDFYKIIEKLNKDLGITILLISHDLSSSGKYTNKIILLNKKLLFYGDYNKFKNSNHAEFYYGDCPVHLNE